MRHGPARKQARSNRPITQDDDVRVPNIQAECHHQGVKGLERTLDRLNEPAVRQGQGSGDVSALVVPEGDVEDLPKRRAVAGNDIRMTSVNGSMQHFGHQSSRRTYIYLPRAFIELLAK